MRTNSAASENARGTGWTFHNTSIVNGATVQDTMVTTDNAFVPTRTVSDNVVDDYAIGEMLKRAGAKCGVANGR